MNDPVGAKFAESPVRDYVDHGRLTVPGWFTRADALLFVAIDEAQKRARVVGDIMEIGVYMGRCAVLLGYLQRPGERLVVCDIFDEVDANTSDETRREYARFYSGLSRQAFERNFRRFHSRLPDEIVAGPSASFRTRLGELRGKFRLIHIDGAHDFDAVRDDIELSRELLAEGGMVVFDDVATPHTPGVAAAVWSAVVSEGLIPHFLTTKLYASWGDVPATCLSPLIEEWTFASQVIAGHPLLSLHERGTPRQILREWVPPAMWQKITSIASWVLRARRLLPYTRRAATPPSP